MSRYPGTQFKVYDNSQATAIVPINTRVNINDAVRYISAFESVKGPEGIKSAFGQEFYDMYGDQSTVKFDKYGQPLFQASMNINNGAALYAKRVVLDDATLGNTTLAMVLTKYADGNVTVDDDQLIASITYTDVTKTQAKYSLTPLMFSVDNTFGYNLATVMVNEYKERYDLYKNKIIEVVSNEGNTDADFLNKLKEYNNNSLPKVLSGFTQSIYIQDDGGSETIITDITNPTERAKINKIRCVTSGLVGGAQKTWTTDFDPSDIIGNVEFVNVSNVAKTDNIYKDDADTFTIVKFVPKTTDDQSDVAHWEVDSTKHDTYANIAVIPLERFVKTTSQLEALIKEEWKEKDFTPESTIYALVEGTYDGTDVTTADPEFLIDDDVLASYIGNSASSTANTIRFLNDMMVKNSGYIVCEYIFPMFTIFDNGRGESTKSISIEYDANSSMSMGKAIYTLNVFNSATSKRLEKYSFSLNPYAKNNATGYTFDIESAVNYKSSQISVNTYYDCYDALLATMQAILETNDEVIEKYDIVFGHLLNGNYPAFNAYQVSTLLRRYNTVTDYAHLDIFSRDILTINTYADCDNMSIISDQVVKYYYYNYTRPKMNILEKLEKGSYGYCLDRGTTRANTGDPIPFMVVDYSDENNIIGMENLKLSGLRDGFIVSATDSIDCYPTVGHNFVQVKVTVTGATKYTLSGSTTSTSTCRLIDSDKTRKCQNVCASQAAAEAYLAAHPTDAAYVIGTGTTDVTVYVPYARNRIVQEQYRRFYNGEFDRDIFNLDIYFPNAVFDANYDDDVKLAIQRLAAYRGDFMVYLDMGLGKIHSYEDCEARIPNTMAGQSLTPATAETDKPYVRDMHIAVTCISYKIRNPYDNKVIYVSGTYGLSNLYVALYRADPASVFAGIGNGVTINNIIEGSVSYIPKIYPTSDMTSLSNIGNVYPSEDETIINEKQKMCDLRVNYGCYYDDRFSIETEYTMHPVESEFSYWNNVALVCAMMQDIRKACPAARYKFINANDLSVYQKAVETAMEPWRSKFAVLRFRYVQDQTALENKIFYAAIEVAFQPFAQAEIFELTALNYSTVSSSITAI